MAITVSALDLVLDTNNPRFLDSVQDEAKAIQYLVKYSRIKELAESIVSNGGLYVGERIVAVRNQEGSYQVLEGNRRTCACKLLLNRQLIPKSIQSVFPVATEPVISSLQNIEIDVVENKGAAERFLASRHVGSVMLWSPLAKMKFFVDQFEAGSSVQEIANSTYTTPAKVRKGIVLRVFLELTLEKFIHKEKIKVKTKKGHPTLREKYLGVLDYIETAQITPLSKRDIDALRKIDVDELHDYVHRLHYQPTDHYLLSLWDNMQCLIEVIYY